MTKPVAPLLKILNRPRGGFFMPSLESKRQLSAHSAQEMCNASK